MMCINAHKVIVVLPRNGTKQGAQNESSAIFSKFDVGSESIRRDNPPGLFEHIPIFVSYEKRVASRRNVPRRLNYCNVPDISKSP